MSRVVLIDADSLVYQSSKESLYDSLTILDEKVDNIFKQTQADKYAMFISQGKYFRHDIYPEYKGQRKTYPSQLKWLKTLKSYLVEGYSARALNKIEADDVVAYFYNTYKDSKEVTPIIASTDKDVLFTIPGKHFNYSYKLPDKDDLDSLIKGWWVDVTQEEADEYFKYLLIAGDTSDNILTPFPENCAKANKILTIEEILSGYINGLPYTTPSGQKKFRAGLGASEGYKLFDMNYKLLSLLITESDYNKYGLESPGAIDSYLIDIEKNTTNLF